MILIINKLLVEIRDNLWIFAGCVYCLVTIFVVAGVELHSWPKALLFIGAFPILAIGFFAIIYAGFLFVALIYGGIFYLFDKNPRYRWWD